MRRASMHTTRRRGFTLIELMVSLVAGSLVITAAWRMSSVSTQMFNRQMRRADMGAAVRRATAIMRRDLVRAGYLSIRDAAEMPVCGGAPVSPVNQPGVSVSPIAVGTLPAQQALYVTGNLTSNDQYPTLPIANANALVLNVANDEFRFSFVAPGAAAACGAQCSNEVLRAFLPNPAQPLVAQGRYISISNGQFVFLRQLTGVQIDGNGVPTLTFQPALPLQGGGAGGGACIANGQTLLVAPVATYRYAIEQSPVAGMQRMANTDALIGGQQRLMLVRREVNMATRAAATPTTIPGTEFVILDFVESFQVGAVWNSTLPTAPGVAGGPPVLAFVAQPQTLDPLRQWMIRSLIIDLVVRPPSERAVGARNQDEGRSEEGRRWSRFEVNLPNMAKRAGAL